MIYLLYKTTNKINGKFYIGVHRQESTEFDGYLGSGTSIKIAIKTYGKENFLRETLEIFDDAEQAYSAEKLALKDVYKGSNCYNRHPGGRGIRDYNSLNITKVGRMSDEAKIKLSKRMKKNNPNYMPGVREKISKSKLGIPNTSTACCHPVIIDGVHYRSKTAASKALGISFSAVINRLNRNSNDIRKLSDGNPVKFELNGIIYNSFKEIKQIFFPDLCIPTAKKRLREMGMVRAL